MAASCPDHPVPPPSCSDNVPCDGAMPYNAADGSVEQSFSFLQTAHGSFDLTWYNRYESGGKPDSPDFGLGKNWSAWQFARLTDHGDNISIMFSPSRTGGCGCESDHTFWFQGFEQFSRIVEPCFDCLGLLTKMAPLVASTVDDFRLVDKNGIVSVFDGTNHLIKSQTTPGGQVTEYIHDTTLTPNRITDIQRTYAYGTNQETIESRSISYIDVGGEDNVQFVTLRRATDSSNPSWTSFRRLEFVYYTSVEAGKGNVGDLKLIKEQLPGASPGTWMDDKAHLFRYYTPLESNGFTHALKYVLSPEAYDRMSDPEGSTNAELAQFASVYYQYDANRRVNEVSTEGGQVTETISYTPHTPGSYDPLNWVLKSVITRRDGLQKTVYANHIAQDLLTDDQDGTDHWITYRKYNADYRLAEQVHPSAIDMSGTPYNQNFDDLDCQIETDAGRIDVFTYYTTTDGTTGAARGYLHKEGVKEGTTNPVVDIRLIKYATQTINGGQDNQTTIHPVSETTTYRSDTGGGDPVTTTTQYSFFSGTVQIEEATTNLPDVPDGSQPGSPDENGVNYPQQDTVKRGTTSRAGWRS